MPTYEYECEDTGRRFELFQGIKDDPLRKCPECGGPVRRLISGGGGAIFKGAGFYATDSRRPSSCSYQATGQRCCERAGADGPPASCPRQRG